MEYDIESILEMYEDDYNPDPRPMAQEPRNMYNQGSSVDHAVRTMDPVQDSGHKIDQVLGAYRRYRRGEKNPRLSFSKFFKLFSTENFATGGQAGQLVSNTVDGSRPGYAGVKGQDRGAVQNLYDQFGKNVINKLSREKFGKNFDKVEGGRGANARNNFIRRIKKKGPLNIEEMQLAGRNLQVKNRLGIQLDILEDLKKGPVTVEALAKKYKVSQKVIKENGTKLLKNIYNKNVQMGKGVERGGRFLPNDDVAIDKILNNISKSPKLAVIQKDQIGRLFYDAFGREKLSNGKKNPTYNSKKYTAILKNLNEYNNIKKIISDKYPNIKLELDHPLSKSTLRKFFNASVDELVAVNPLERSLNQGFKKSLSDSYEKAITGEGNLKQKKAIQKIAKDLNINIGNVSNNFSKYNKGVKSFEKLNIKDEVLKSMQTQADLNSNLKGYVKQNPDLFKTANVNPNSKITKVTQGQVKQIASLLEKLGCGKSAGGRIMFGNGTTCAIKGRKKLEQVLLKGAANKTESSLANNILKAGKGLKNMASLKNLFGPAALAFGVATEAGFVGYDMLASGKPFKQAVGDSLFNYMLGDKTKIDSDEVRLENYRNLGIDTDKIIEFENGIKEIGQMNKTYGDEAEAKNTLMMSATTSNPRVSQAIKDKSRLALEEDYKEKQLAAQNLTDSLNKPETQERFDKIDFNLMPNLIEASDQRVAASQVQKPSTTFFNKSMQTIFPKTNFMENRDKTINYQPVMQDYYRTNQYSAGGIADLMKKKND